MVLRVVLCRKLRSLCRVYAVSCNENHLVDAVLYRFGNEHNGVNHLNKALKF